MRTTCDSKPAFGSDWETFRNRAQPPQNHLLINFPLPTCQLRRGNLETVHTVLSAVKPDCGNTTISGPAFSTCPGHCPFDTETHDSEKQPAGLSVVAPQCTCVLRKPGCRWWGPENNPQPVENPLLTGWSRSHRVSGLAPPLHCIEHYQSYNPP